MGIYNGIAHCSWCGRGWNRSKQESALLGMFFLIWDCLTLFSFWWRPHFCSRACKLEYKKNKGK
jgi:hypothetical protein